MTWDGKTLIYLVKKCARMCRGHFNIYINRKSLLQKWTDALIATERILFVFNYLICQGKALIHYYNSHWEIFRVCRCIIYNNHANVRFLNISSAILIKKCYTYVYHLIKTWRLENPKSRSNYSQTMNDYFTINNTGLCTRVHDLSSRYKTLTYVHLMVMM